MLTDGQDVVQENSKTGNSRTREGKPMQKRRTEFGKFVAQLRIEQDLLLMEMANGLEVTPAYLSNVEHGRRKIPPEWFDKIRVVYNLDLPSAANLKRAILRSNKDVQLEVKTEAQATLLAAYEMKKDSLDESTAKRVAEILCKGDRK
ncbi:MAG: helix-turn-helix transcriptional regulator [Pseudomonadota bacterium]